METVRCRDVDPDMSYTVAHIKPNQCFWKEYPDSKKRFAFCIRVFAVFGQGIDGYETVGEWQLPVDLCCECFCLPLGKDNCS